MAKTTTTTASSSRQETSRLASLVAELAQGEGISPSRLADVKFMRTTHCHPRGPVSYEPGIFIIVQGRKTGYLGRRRFVYDANNYLVLAVPLPFECEVEGTPEAPLLGVKIGVTPATVAELCMQIEQGAPIKRQQLQAIEATPLDEALSNCTERLLECLRSADDARILGPQIAREITYRADYARSLDVGTFARYAGMSVSTFHAHFKAVTSSSPLQYLKNVRLHKARMLMVNEGATASTAASQVGYVSASQFSREFKRLFGDGPAAVANQLRRSLIHLS
jgi:AraC-like DNA-binding protein